MGLAADWVGVVVGILVDGFGKIGVNFPWRQNWGDLKQNLAPWEMSERKSLRRKVFRKVSMAPRGLLTWRIA